MPFESTVIVRGTVKEDARQLGGVEVSASEFQVCSTPPSASSRIGKKEHGVGFLMDNRHLWLRSSAPPPPRCACAPR